MWNLYKYDFDTNGADLILNDSNDSWIDRDPFIIPGEIGTWTTKRGFSFAIMDDGEIIWLSEKMDLVIFTEIDLMVDQ